MADSDEAPGVMPGASSRQVVVRGGAALASLRAELLGRPGWSEGPGAAGGAGAAGAGAAAGAAAGGAGAGAEVVWLDEACPGTTAADVDRVLATARREGCAAVGVRPVHDTLVELDGALLGGAVDRDAHRVVAAPLAVAGGTAAAVGGLLMADSLLAALDALGDGGPVALVEVPPGAART